MTWKVVAAGGEHELQKELDKLQGRVPRKDEHGDCHLVGTISQLVPIGVGANGTLFVVAKVEVARDPPLPESK